MPASPLPMEISAHALERWAERVRHDESMRPTAAKADMQRCAAAGTLQPEPPDWMYLHPDLINFHAEYLMLGDDVAIVVRRRRDDKPWVVATVMTRHDAGGAHAAELRAQRRARRAAQRRRKPSTQCLSSRPPVEPWNAAEMLLDATFDDA